MILLLRRQQNIRILYEFLFTFFSVKRKLFKILSSHWLSFIYVFRFYISQSLGTIIHVKPPSQVSSLRSIAQTYIYLFIYLMSQYTVP